MHPAYKKWINEYVGIVEEIKDLETKREILKAKLDKALGAGVHQGLYGFGIQICHSAKSWKDDLFKARIAMFIDSIPAKWHKAHTGSTSYVSITVLGENNGN